MNLNDCIELMRVLQVYKSKTSGKEQQRIINSMTKVDAIGKVLAANAKTAWKW
jgi:hypothetical protein